MTEAAAFQEGDQRAFSGELTIKGEALGLKIRAPKRGLDKKMQLSSPLAAGQPPVPASRRGQETRKTESGRDEREERAETLRACQPEAVVQNQAEKTPCQSRPGQQKQKSQWASSFSLRAVGLPGSPDSDGTMPQAARGAQGGWAPPGPASSHTPQAGDAWEKSFHNSGLRTFADEDQLTRIKDQRSAHWGGTAAWCSRGGADRALQQSPGAQLDRAQP